MTPPPIHAVSTDFPAVFARTQGFSLGVPRHFVLAADHALFLRGEGDSPTQSLWRLDTDGETRLVDGAALDAAGVPPEELARRERARERGSGIVTFACDAEVRTAAFAAGGKLLTVDVHSGELQQLAVDGPVVDPRPDPTGQRIAYVEDQALWVTRLDGTNAPRRLVGDRNPTVSWGLAEFVAGEEMGRTRGYWWAPDGQSLLVARVDTAPVRTWWIAGPVNPDARPTEIRYPAAGTPNAEVTLHQVSLNGEVTPLVWDRDSYPYLAEVTWPTGHPATVVVQSRNQQRLAFLELTDTGEFRTIATEDDSPWIELIPGSPVRLSGGELVRVVQLQNTRLLDIGGRVTTDVGLMIASIVGVDPDDGVIVTAHTREQPWCTVVARVFPEGPTQILSDPEGVASAVMGGGRLAITQRRPGTTAVEVTVGETTARSLALTPPPLPAVRRRPVGSLEQPVTQVFLPDGWTPDAGPLPVLVDPYGGPGARRVLGAGAANLTSQWFAANGFAVLVTDGPGSPGQSLSWGARIAGDFARPTLGGQIEALERTADANPGMLDLERVGIRGWSFGGYLAALAVLRRPDVFHAAVSGAPVTDWRLYDTHYTERFLGHPDISASAYDQSSIIADAGQLSRPLMLIHGLADDNVVSAHTLRLSRALLETGRPHQVLPLSGVTHFTPSETLNTNLLLLQFDFLRRSLGLAVRDGQS
ncbi:S9 family peptidase [Euzebya tangerina]|uniref:S9 family peptidase n=1 Tax=Euzebya tangerina TaxID=591198 RepID=UPI00196B6A3D|nr:prolyl oligopeptidase family serine peptidase [Euzebya tangerina]